MEANTSAIIRLAWARMLGLAFESLGAPNPGRITAVDESRIMFLSLWNDRVLVGPQWLLERAMPLEDRALQNGSSLLSLAADHGGRLLGQVDLAYRDAYVDDEGLEELVATDDPEAARDLECGCPPDDVAEVKLAEMSRQLITLDELDHTTAGAGYVEWAGLLAHLGALTPPQLRRSGHGTRATALAVNDALDAGLVPQWRARTGHRAAQAISRRLGFSSVGSQTTVLLPR